MDKGVAQDRTFRHVLVMLGLYTFISIACIAQDRCSYFPADCPDDGMIQAARDSEACIRNLILPQEIAMQNRLREELTVMMEGIARREKWDVYEFTEEAGSGIGIGDNTKPLPYALRRPYQFFISFDFVINKDSLARWQSWFQNTLKEKSDEVVEAYRQEGSGSEQRAADSATYYSNQLAKYMTDHAAEYQQAILSSDAGARKKYEQNIKKYQDKIDSYTGRANAQTDARFAKADQKSGDLQTFKKQNTIAYRNGSTMRVSFSINPNTTASFSDPIKIVRKLPLPPYCEGMILHNSDPDLNSSLQEFRQNPDVAVVLFGKWSSKVNQWDSYDAVYRSDKKAMDNVSVKDFPCDKVQTITMYVEGRPGKIEQFVQLLDISALKRLLVGK